MRGMLGTVHPFCTGQSSVHSDRGAHKTLILFLGFAALHMSTNKHILSGQLPVHSQ